MTTDRQSPLTAAKEVLQNAMKNGFVYARITGTDERKEISIVLKDADWQKVKAWLTD